MQYLLCTPNILPYFLNDYIYSVIYPPTYIYYLNVLFALCLKLAYCLDSAFLLFFELESQPLPGKKLLNSFSQSSIPTSSARIKAYSLLCWKPINCIFKLDI